MSKGRTRISRLVGVVFAAIIAQAASAAPRVMSLDQCADQYVLALAPRADIVGVSPRVGDADSYLKAFSAGLPRRRGSSEAVLAAGPQVVVRYWGGDSGLARTLAARGVAVAQINEAADFDGVRANIRRVAAALDAPARGEALIARMDAQLQAGHGAGGGREALYLTPSGVSAGRGVLVDAMLRAVTREGVSFAALRDDPLFRALHKRMLLLFKGLLSVPMLQESDITTAYRTIFGLDFPLMNRFYESDLFT